MPEVFRFCRTSLRRSTFTDLTAVLASCLVAMACQAAAVPIPTLHGPLPEPLRQGIGVWGGVGELGYTVGEYLASGRANVYEPLSMADARNMRERNNVKDLARRASYTPVLRQRDVPYTTRILVYKPIDPKRFSGNVIVEIVHPAGGGHLAVFSKANGLFLSHGDAYVAVEHPLNFHGLELAEPARYGALRAADPTQIWGMVAQVGALLRSDSPANPLADYHVRFLFLTGYSYTGVATATFADYYHDGARLEGGAPIFSGYLPFANGMYVRPLDVPVIRVNTQSDFNSFGGLDNRRRDSDSPGDRYRLYEVAGASHVNASPVTLPQATPPRPVKLQQAGGLPKGGDMMCQNGFPRGAEPNMLAVDYVLAQAFLNMYRWVEDGVPPPHAPLIATDANGKPKLDRNGNAIGGVRLPALVAPSATYGIGPGKCWLLGYQVPFTKAKMKALYGTREAYITDVERAARRDVEDRLIPAAAARAIVAKAKAKTPW